METRENNLKWPDFGEPELTARLRLDQSAFLDLWFEMVEQFPIRDFDREAYEHGIGYPWSRPEGCFVLEEGEGILLGDRDSASRQESVARFTGPDSGRLPMLAIGSNASPEGLWRKFGHFERPEDRTLFAARGWIHDFDVVAAAELAFYGALPATISPSPGTRVEATAIWLTEAQLTQLAWAEIPYWIGWLKTRFEVGPEASGLGLADFDNSLVFVNRFGAFAPDSRPLALAPIPAENRAFPTASQEELLGRAAELAYGPNLGAKQLVERIFTQPTEAMRLVTEAVLPHAIPFKSDRWTAHPG